MMMMMVVMMMIMIMMIMMMIMIIMMMMIIIIIIVIITVIRALAVPVLRYNFGIINWRIEEIEQIGRKTRKMLTMYKVHHPQADTDRLYAKRKGTS
jgi:hypothetical protein